MAAIIKPKRWNEKPNYGVQVSGGHPLANGLIGCFPLNEGQGSSVTNIVTGKTYPFQGSPVWRNTRYGMGLDCSTGNDTGVLGTAESILRPSGDVSVFWRGYLVGTPSANSAFAGVMYNAAETSPFIAYAVACEGSSKLAGWFNNAGLFQSDPGSAITTYTDGSIHNFVNCINFGTNDNRVYADKRQDGSGSAGGLGGTISYNSDAPLIIGTTKSGDARNSQSVGIAVYIWKRQLPFNEINWLYEEPYALFTPKIPRLITFGINTGVSRALNSILESYSELKPTPLSKSFNFSEIKIESISELKPILTKPVALPGSYIETISGLKVDLQKPKYLTTKLESNSELVTGISKFLGALKLSATLKPIPPTSYTKGYKRPIAYLKNDNDNYGSTTETVKSSPGDNDFS